MLKSILTLSFCLILISYCNVIYSQTWECATEISFISTSDIINSQSNNIKDSDNIYIIPIVFHVLYNDIIDSISTDQIFEGIEQVNNDFRKLNSDTIDIISPFTSIASDCKIELRLAKKDPFGNACEGINYIPTDSSGFVVGWNVQYDSTGGKSAWPTDKYLNIWVVEMFSGITGGGRGTLPDTIFLERQGIVITNNMIGSIGTGLGRRVFTHELGHFLNLYHLWGKLGIPGDTTNCNKDDEVADTPNCFGSSYYYGTPSGLWAESCGSQDNTQNYMDYSPFDIVCMFTEGQALRMHQTLNSNIAGRNNLHSEQNLIFTGVIDPESILLINDNSSFNIFPNPSRNYIHITSENALIHKVECYNYYGIRIFTYNYFSNNNVNISISHLDKGVYFIKINDNNCIKLIKL